MRNPFSALAGALARRLFGISADEIRYTFEDVRAEIRATREELKREIADLRGELRSARPDSEDQPEGPETPVAEA